MSKDNEFPGWHGTTIVAVRKGNKVVVGASSPATLPLRAGWFAIAAQAPK